MMPRNGTAYHLFFVIYCFVLKVVCVSLLVSFLFAEPCLNFNLETRHYVVHRGPISSKFGFSLAQHKDALGNHWIIVGAPEAMTNQPGVQRAGSVFRCHPFVSDSCQPIPFDNKGNHYDGSQYVDDKSYQWFGASVVSQGGVVAACAPRYVWYSMKKSRREPIGRCFLLIDESSNKIESYSPCMNEYWGFHRQGTCQAGFGLALTQRGNRVYIGAVGSWYWQGQIFYKNLLNKQDLLTSSESPKQFDMSYLGYSVTSGHFDDDLEEDIAVGVPRGEELKGKVVVFSYNLRVLYNITGDQMGSYFGYSVASLDTNGDGLHDIVVGAPWYTNFNDPTMKYEIGMVSCFRHTQQHNFRRSVQLFGEHSRSHFGLSLSSLKDINRDGYEDLAVGAPQAGLQGRGGVYIFLGGPQGLKETPSQIILAEELTHVGIKTFGWSVSGGQDLDRNDYPDLTVGAQESDRAYVFRSRPVIHVNASVKIRSENGAFDLENKRCSLFNGTDVACKSLLYCLSYTGQGVPPTLGFSINLVLDTASQDIIPRVSFIKQEGISVLNSSMPVRKDVRNCLDLLIYALPNPHDKLTPIQVEFTYALPAASDYTTIDSRYPDLYPILTPAPFGKINKVKDTIYFQNNCGADNICISDLRGKAFLNQKEYILGSERNILLNLTVENGGEDSYQSEAVITVPKSVHFSKYIVLTNESETTVTPFCTLVTESKPLDVKTLSNDDNGEKYKNNKVVCEIGNPLPSSTELRLQLVFQPDPISIGANHLSFDIILNSTNQDDAKISENNILKISIPVIRRSEIDFRGISWPEEQFNYNASYFGQSLLGTDLSIEHEKEAGPEVTHIYDVINRGPSDLPNVEIYLLWPSNTLAGDPLLYLVEEPKISPDNLTCESTPDVNDRNIEIESPVYDQLVASPFQALAEDDSNIISRELREVSDFVTSMRLFSDNSSTPPDKLNKSSKKLEELLTCGSTRCSVTKCTAPFLKAGQHVFVRVRSRLWADTIQKLGITDMKISSRLVIHSSNELTSDQENWSEKVSSYIKTRTDTPVPSLSWLIWLGSSLVGLLLLALLILLLWMLGFFKRKRPQDESEDELIHKNGSNGRL